MTIRATTIVCVRRDGQVAIGGDGQVTLGHTVMKSSANKLRKLYNDQVLTGFAGATADAFMLFDHFEGKLEKHQGNLMRSVAELAKDWRSDRVLRRLEAMLLVADQDKTFIISGGGDIIEPEDCFAAIGSGSPYAIAAAKALTLHTEMDAPSIAKEALTIAADICIYTNSHISIETL